MYKCQPHPLHHLALQLSYLHQLHSKHEGECVPMVHQGGYRPETKTETEMATWGQ